MDKKNLIKVLGLASLLCLLILAFRIFWSSSIYYAFLIWNLFLAWIPLFLSSKIIKMNETKKSGFIIGFLFLAWLLFLPNSPYILTDILHFKERENIPMWYDLILVIAFAWNGLIIGFISLLEIQKFLNKIFTKKLSWLIVIIAIILSSFGIYLGRYGRWNSWDVITNPISLTADIIDRFANPLNHPRTIGITILFSLFLILSYLTLFLLIQSKKNEH